MKYETISLLHLDTSNPKAAGLKHGEELREKIAGAAQVRWELMRNEPGFSSDAILQKIAREHLPILQSFDDALYQELLGIAEGSNQPVERIVVLNNYTDMRDLALSLKDDGGCSTLFIPTPHGPILGQTWDIHSSALPYVVMLEITQKFDDKNSESAYVFSMAGCLGMTGLSSQGVAITINNLCSIDASIGIVWSALVRKVLCQQNAQQARDCIMNAALGSGHHYIVADEDEIFAISTSGTKKKIMHEDSMSIHFHANHCVDDEMAKTHIVKTQSTTYVRHEKMAIIAKEQKLSTANDVFEALGEVSYAPQENNPTQVGTCGAMVMDIAQRKVLACAGPPSEKIFHNRPRIFQL